MAGIGIDPAQPLSTSLLSPASLVAPASPVVTPNAVAALSDAFRSGQVSADDIISRYGDLAKTGQKAEIQGLHEFISPDAIAARKAAIQAGGAQAQLTGATATSALDSVDLAQKARETNLQASIYKAQAAPGDYEAKLTALTQAGVVIPVNLEQGLTPENRKQIDEEFGNVLNWNAQRMMAAQFVQASKVGDTTQTTVDAAGNTRTVKKIGSEIRGPSGEPLDKGEFQQIRFMATTPYQVWKAHDKPNFLDAFKTAPGSSQTVPTVAPKAAVAPVDSGIETPAVSAARAKLTSVVPNDELNSLTPNQVLQKYAEATTAPKPVISPTGEVSPSDEIVTETKAANAPALAEKLSDQVRKQESYKSWNAAKPFFGSMANVMNEVNSMTPEQQRNTNMNVKDIELLSNFIKLYDPNAVIREFKFDKLVDSMPYVEALKNWKNVVLRTGHLSPETRQELFNVGSQAFHAKEQSIAPDVKMAADRASRLGLDVGDVLSSEEQNILNGKFSAAPSARVAPATGPVISLSTGRKLQRLPDGSYQYVQ